MSEKKNSTNWKTLDRDLNRISVLESANAYVTRPLVAPGLALAFLILAGLVSIIFFADGSKNYIVVY